MKVGYILKTMQFIFWVIFVGLCLSAVREIFYSFYSPLGDFEYLKKASLPLDFLEHSEVSSTWYYLSHRFIVIALFVMKAYLAYLVTRIFSKINFSSPFNQNTTKLLVKISNAALLVSMVALISNSYNIWVYKRDFLVSVLDAYEESPLEFLFLSAILFIIAQIFKKGTEIQSENELTV